ncbi:MAG: PIN domain-containing protein [Acidobacteria bacterium]|nr:PIN domain-containing protein [Acidobacteriota bacterium]
MKGAKVFFDTNVLIYVFDKTSKQKAKLAMELIDSATGEGRGVLSMQVIQEFINIMRRGQKPLMSVAQCRVFLGVLTERFELVRQTPDLLTRGLYVHEAFQISWYDSLIVAAAQAGGCDVLYSEDLSHGQAYGSVRVLNPFAGA